MEAERAVESGSRLTALEVVRFQDWPPFCTLKWPVAVPPVCTARDSEGNMFWKGPTRA